MYIYIIFGVGALVWIIACIAIAVSHQNDIKQIEEAHETLRFHYSTVSKSLDITNRTSDFSKLILSRRLKNTYLKDVPEKYVYTGASVLRVFLITAATFGAMSLYGYTTKKDLTSMGSFLIMGLWGIIIASLVNIFMQSATVYWVISYIGIAIFVGLTAYDTQKIRTMYLSGDSEDIITRKAVIGAVELYMDFINLFIYLLRVMGDRK